MIQRYTLGKNEKLKSKKAIETLFTEGESFVQFPIRVVFIKNETSSPNQVAFSVSKRNFKLAVDRNKIKRLMREAYRLNKHDLESKGFHLIFIYTHRKIKPFSAIVSYMKTILKTIEKK